MKAKCLSCLGYYFLIPDDLVLFFGPRRLCFWLFWGVVVLPAFGQVSSPLPFRIEPATRSFLGLCPGVKLIYNESAYFGHHAADEFHRVKLDKLGRPLISGPRSGGIDERRIKILHELSGPLSITMVAC